MRKEEGEVVEMMQCPLLVHPFELGLTPLRLKMDNTVADWGSGEARASQKDSGNTDALAPTSGNQMRPRLGSKMFSLTLHGTLHQLATQGQAEKSVVGPDRACCDERRQQRLWGETRLSCGYEQGGIGTRKEQGISQGF